jgi:hypothetical protein
VKVALTSFGRIASADDKYFVVCFRTLELLDKLDYMGWDKTHLMTMPSLKRLMAIASMTGRQLS